MRIRVSSATSEHSVACVPGVSTAVALLAEGISFEGIEPVGQNSSFEGIASVVLRFGVGPWPSSRSRPASFTVYIASVLTPDVSTGSPGVLVDRPVLRQTLVPVAVLCGVVGGSILGFVLSAGVGVVEAAYWLISPANVGIHIRNNGGPATAIRAFAVLSRVSIVLSSLWLGQTVLSALFGGQITEGFKRVQQERTISSLSDHAVICGYGMFGETIAQHLEDDGRAIVIVERETDTVRRAERDDHLVVDGDARQEATLDRANIGAAGTVVAAVDDSNVNIQVGILARQLAPDAKLVVRIGDEMYESTARRAGADRVVIPEIMSGDDVADELTSGALD